MHKKQFDRFLFIGKPQHIKSEDISCGNKLTFKCNVVKITMGNLTGFFEDCEIVYYTAKKLSVTELNEANTITLEGIIGQAKDSKNRELVALTLRSEK